MESIVNNAKKTATPSGSTFRMEDGSWKMEQSLIITSEAVAANAVPLQLYQPTALLRTDLLGQRPSSFAVKATTHVTRGGCESGASTERFSEATACA